jgi:hypothetical protein
MKQYYKIIDGQTVFFKNPLVVGDMQIINPSEEILLAAGWLEYIPPEPEPVDTTKYEPYTDEVVAKIKQLIQEQVAQQSDEEALENIELFPTWQSKIGVQVNQGDRLYFDDKLFKVLQTHTPQEDWRPDTTASLYVQVVADEEQGTIDNPIPYSVNMELVQGLYYIEDGIVYLCTVSLAASYWALKDLVGTYVELVN